MLSNRYILEDDEDKNKSIDQWTEGKKPQEKKTMKYLTIPLLIIGILYFIFEIIFQIKMWKEL